MRSMRCIRYTIYLYTIWCYIPIISSAQPSYIYEGGIGNGYVSILYNANMDLLYNGGLDDGYASISLSSNNALLYKGGIDDGYASIPLISNNDLLYKGGMDDGYASIPLASNNDMLYKGGVDDGYSSMIKMEDFIWTGAIGEGWNISGNWNYNIIPDIHRRTIIPSGVPHYPHLNAGIFAIGDNPNNGSFESGELWIKPNAWLVTRVSNYVENYGKITIDGDMWVKNPNPFAFYNKGDIDITNNGQLTLSQDNPFICGQSITYGGQNYNTVQIGDQCWLAENLNIGSMINSTQSPSNNSTKEKYCYNNLSTNCDTYGGLYSWNEMMDYQSVEGSQGICPTGWHIPTDDEYKTLEINQGMSVSESNNVGWRGSNEGSKLAGDAALWTNGNLELNVDFNTSGDQIIPGGILISSGTFSKLNTHAYQWTSSKNANNAWYRNIAYFRTDILRLSTNVNKAYSVRCIKD